MDSTGRSDSPNTRYIQFWTCGISIVFILASTFAAYKPVLFNFFFMDDFCFLAWLREAIHSPSILLHTFFDHYMNEPYYYRPLITLFWALEFLLCGYKGLLYRLCSIIVMLASSLVVGLIVFELSKKTTRSTRTRLVWAFFSAALFDLYPLHVSAVNWFAAQHTVLVALFYLLAFWCYLSWRHTSAKSFFIASICCFILSLLTEEMAATLPFILLTYESLCTSSIFITTNHLRFLQKLFLVTSPYWLVLAAYFIVRNIVLGKLSNQFSGVSHQGISDLAHRLQHGLKHLLVPIDVSIIDKHSPVTFAWEIIIISCLILSFYTFIAPSKESHKKALGFLLLIWFLMGIAPASNIFGRDIFPSFICDRVTFLATVPFCIFITYGIANFSSGSKYATLVRTISGAFFILSSLILYCNNEAYCYIGQRSNEIITDLQKHYKSISGDPALKILGLPPPTNALGVHHITRKPFLERDFDNCYILDADDPTVSFGFLRESTNKQEGKISFLYWDAKELRLKPTLPYSIPISAEFPVADFKKHWQGHELKTLIHNGTRSPAQISWEDSNVLHLISDKPSHLDIDLAGYPCWPIGFINFKVKITPLPAKHKIARLEYKLHFANNISQSLKTDKYSAVNTFSKISILPNGREQNLIFPLRDLPYWALGGKCLGLQLFLPPRTDMRLTEVSLPEARTIIPMISGPSEVKLNCFSSKQQIPYDASHINNCSQVVLEIIGPYELPNSYVEFETPYSDKPDNQARFNIPANSSTGKLEIDCASFPAKGTYKARLRALDKNEKQVGLASDEFIIDIDE